MHRIELQGQATLFFSEIRLSSKPSPLPPLFSHCYLLLLFFCLACIFAMQSLRFIACDRVSELVKINSPSLEILWACCSCSLLNTCGGRCCFAIDKLNLASALVLTLFTFCPPALIRNMRKKTLAPCIRHALSNFFCTCSW